MHIQRWGSYPGELVYVNNQNCRVCNDTNSQEAQDCKIHLKQTHCMLWILG